MPKSTSLQKVECLNPNTGGTMNIDKNIYDLISKAIYHTLKSGKSLTYSEIVEGIHDHFKKQKIKFEGSIPWYAVTVKHDMHARGIIEVFTEKGRKMHKLRKKWTIEQGTKKEEWRTGKIEVSDKRNIQ